MITLTLPQPVLFVLHSLYRSGFEGYVVGGAVRDVLMQKDTHDWDFTTNATPEEIQRLFPGSFYDNTFGTVGVAAEHLGRLMTRDGWTGTDNLTQDPTWNNQVLEITTYRTESGYTDKRRPDTVSWGKTLAEDLSRRDFTVNAMAISLNPELGGMVAYAMKQSEVEVPADIVDPFGGQADLDKRVVRAVGNPETRFNEDALRMMRAIRFGAQLGFAIEPATLAGIQANASLIKHVSWERIRDELLKILASPYPADGVQLLANAGLLDYVIPEMLPMRGVQQGGHHIYDVWTHSLESLRHCPSTDPLVRLATLLHDVGKPVTMRLQGPRGVTFYGHEVVGARIARDIGKRLRLSNKEVDKLFTLVRWHMFVYNPEMTDAAIRRFIKRVGLENINDMLLLRVGDRKGGGSQATSWRLRELQQRIGEQLYEPLSVKDLKVNGTDVMEVLGVPPGRIVGNILNQLFEEVMEDSGKNTREYLLARIKELGKN